MNVLYLTAASRNGTAYAATAIPGPNGIIHGCYQKKVGTLRVITAKQKCDKKKEIALSWNQKGVTGATGIQGLKGDTGLTGKQGDVGFKGDIGAQGTPGRAAQVFRESRVILGAPEGSNC